MNKTKRLIAFLLCFVLIASLAVTAYAIDMTANIDAPFMDQPDDQSTFIGFIYAGEILRVQSATDNGVWYYGYPDTNATLFGLFGDRRAYSRSWYYSVMHHS